MGNETTKASALPSRQALYSKYIAGWGVDLGAGPDPLSLDGIKTIPFDREDGDAQFFGIGTQSGCDFVYSSHCLEHMIDVPQAVYNWAGSLREGGFLFVIVPDFLLYERLQWPSKYNDDHKAAFSLFTIDPARRPDKFYGFAEMKAIGEASGMDLVHAETEAIGYDFTLLPHAWLDQTAHFNACANVIFVFRKR